MAPLVKDFLVKEGCFVGIEARFISLNQDDQAIVCVQWTQVVSDLLGTGVMNACKHLLYKDKEILQHHAGINAPYFGPRSLQAVENILFPGEECTNLKTTEGSYFLRMIDARTNPLTHLGFLATVYYLLPPCVAQFLTWFPQLKDTYMFGGNYKPEDMAADIETIIDREWQRFVRYDKVEALQYGILTAFNLCGDALSLHSK